jgi:hypothetical protein
MKSTTYPRGLVPVAALAMAAVALQTGVARAQMADAGSGSAVAHRAADRQLGGGGQRSDS